MNDNLEYYVLPHKPKLKPIPPDTKVIRDWNAFEGIWGMVWGGAIFVTIGVIIRIVGGSVLQSLVFSSLITPIIIFGIRRIHFSEQERIKEEMKRQIKEANQSELRRVEGEAASLTSNLTKTYELSTKLATELSQHLNIASGLLREAENEYKDNAFAPFWDAVENAARQLASFNEKANQLSKNAVEYYRMLSGRRHTFPRFPDNNAAIQDAPSVVNELRRVVRLGQTNYQFANIWEQRRTRELLIAGFRTLGDAVNNLEATIEYSISGLQRSISSDVAKLVEEEIRTRDTLDNRLLEQNRMLDNIQHHRKPGITDSPSRY